MFKKTLSILLGAGLVAGALISATPAKAAIPVIPETANIEDPALDGNYINDQGRPGVNVQGTAYNPPDNGDHAGPENASNIGDIHKVWFTNSATELNVHILTQAPAPASAAAVMYRVMVNPPPDAPPPASGGLNQACIWFEAFTPAPTANGVTAPYGRLRDLCNAEFVTVVTEKASVETLEDGRGLTTVTFALNAHPAIAIGQVLKSPTAHSRNAIGSTTPIGPVTPGLTTAPQIDNTTVGTDYSVAKAGPAPKPTPKPKPKPKPKPCKPKNSKKCKPKPKPKKCTPYDGGVDGKDAPLSLVTDAATAEAPVTAEIEVGMGLGTSSNTDNEGSGTVSHQVYNIQVDSKAKETGLWVKVEHDIARDLDLYVSGPDGVAVAYAGGTQAAPVVPPTEVPQVGTVHTNGEGHGGKTTQTSEQVDGLKTADCQGYTIEVWGAGNEDLTATLSFHLGEIVYTPPPSDGQRAKREGNLLYLAFASI
jgi:hypothetical protein